ncbi:MAG: hypothetical protein L3J53_03405 [Proteobacteria bacterium]|nr:hypothetical protein [Pseudomonadota bacterium]
MKTNLYQQLATKKTPWFATRYVIAGLSLMLVTSVMFKISSNQPISQDNVMQAQADLQLAMHYMNRVSFKSLSSVNQKGIKPGLIMPMAQSVASL